MKPRFVMSTVLAAVAIGAVAAAPASGAKLEVSVASVGSPPAAVAPGGGFTVAYRVTRRGAGLRSARLGLYLSPARRKTAGAVALAARAPLSKLRRKRALKGTLLVAIPATTRPATYHLLACVERVKARRPAKPGRCRAAPTPVAVRAPPVAPAPIAAAPPTAATPGPPPEVTPVDATLPPFVPSPRNVAPVLDDARAVTQTVGIEGGALHATGADGTTYALDIPAFALVELEDITMTPLAAIGGLPFADGHGVQLEPDGLTLTGPATLDIVPPAPVPLAEQAAFAYLGSGKDLHLYPTSNQEAVLEFELLHFSAYGYGKATGADRAAQAERVPSDREAWARQNMARAGQEMALATAQGRPSDGARWRGAFQVAWFVWGNEGVRAALTGALTNDAAFEQAATEFNSWTHQGTIMGLTADYPALFDQLIGLYEQAATVFAERAFDRCVQNKDLFQVGRIMAIARMLANLGGSLDTQSDLMTKVDKCARIDVEVDFSLEWLGDPPLAASGNDVGTITFHIRPWEEGGGFGTPTARADPAITAATHLPGGVGRTWTWTEAVVAQQAEVVGPTIDWRRPGPGGEPREPIVELALGWGAVNELGTLVACTPSGCDTAHNIGSGTYFNALTALYWDDISANRKPVFRRWEVETGVGNEVFATKEVERTVHSPMLLGAATEELELRLLHKPVP